ncbi:polysaccharide deacetylase family protein [Pontibacter sp. JH31]|uniref:Polysaccharide deacetylase family protein n=1 Tax=Pontibacter aquaedesilientis TaxID=2766980 RepID=A0ABR7XIF9_9BACT|nr:polysaccharide deacetylase family protein [Pontibacter aquaedesilientis]MBD1397726.1 polysaccharide deacetylase family protein [Pontibacter aquaedesilientis]
MKMSVRNIFSWAIASVLILLGNVRNAKMKALNGDFILSLYFHKPSKAEFERCIKWLKKNNFTFLSIEDILKIIEHDLPLPKGAVLLTLDDGWQSNETNVVEVAKTHRVPVTIFVSTEPVEEGAYWWSYLSVANEIIPDLPSKQSLKKINNDDRLALINTIKKVKLLEREALTVEQVKRMASSEFVTIGGHTHSHPILVNCDSAQVYDELCLSKYKLESWIQNDVVSFAYPNGDYGNREIQLLGMLNYKLAFTNKPCYLTKEKLKHSYELPRFGFLEGASFAENICRVVGIWQPLILKFQKWHKMIGTGKIISSTYQHRASDKVHQMN